MLHLKKVLGQYEEYALPPVPQQPLKRNKVHFRLDDQLHQALRIYVSQNNTTVQQLMEDLVRKVVGGL